MLLQLKVQEAEKHQCKDIVRYKKKVANPSSASLDIYLNHQMGNQTQNEHSNRSDACSPPQIRPPNTPTRCSTVDNIVKNANLSVALNDKGASLGNEFSTSSLANNGAEGSLAHSEIPTIYVYDTRSTEEGPHISVVSNSDGGFHIDN